MVVKKIFIKDVQEVLSLFQNKDLNLMVEFIQLKTKFIFQGNFETNKEILKELKSRIIESLLSLISEYKSRISDCRKAGLKVNLISFDLMRVPLAVAMLKANFNIYFFNKIKIKLEKIEKEILIFEKK